MERTKKKNRMSTVNEASNKPVDDLSQVCKPLSVNITRLPTSVVNKYVARSSAKVKTTRVYKSRHRWKLGFAYKSRKYKKILLRRRKLRQLAMSQFEDETKKPEEITDDTISNSNNLDKESPREISAVDGQELNIDQTPSETRESELTSSENEAPPITELNNELPNVAIHAAEELAKNITARIIHRDTGKRKRPSQPNDARTQGSQRSLRDSKKYKSVDVVATCENEKTLPEEGNIGDSVNEVSSITKQIKLSKLKKHHPKSVRRRINSMQDAKVVLTRLEDSLDPLILQWREKKRLERLNVVEVATSTTSPIEKRVEEKTRLATTEESSVQKSPLKETCNLPITDETSRELSTNVTETPATIVCATPEPKTFTPLDEETQISGPSTGFEEGSARENDENDEEIMHFLRERMPRKYRPSIDSSSSESTSFDQEARRTPLVRGIARTHTLIRSNVDNTSDSEEIVMPRFLRSHAKTPSLIKSSPEKTRPETRMEKMLRLAKTPSIDEPDYDSEFNEESKKTPALGKNSRRTLIDSSTSENTVEPQSTARKLSRDAIDDTSSESTYNPGEALTDMLDSDAPSPTPTHDQNSVEKTVILNNHQRKTEDRAKYRSPDKTANFVDSQQTHEENNRLEAITEVNCDSSVIDEVSDPTNVESSNRKDVLIARKRLSALNAMVVLTRLEDLDDISEDNRHSDYSDIGMEFQTAEDSAWSTSLSRAAIENRTSHATRFDLNSNDNQTPDPLEISREDDQNLARAIDSPMVDLFSRNIDDLNDAEITKSPRKSVVETILHEDNDTRWSQDTAESDVELTLVLEEGERTARELIDQSQTSGVGDSTQNSSVFTPSEGILTDANGNNDSPRPVQNNEYLDEPRNHCSCEAGQRLVCQKFEATYTCITCNRHFNDAKVLENHRKSHRTCNEKLRCPYCNSVYKTSWGLAKHRNICTRKASKERATLIGPTTNEADADIQTEQEPTVESASSKSKQKKPQTQKKEKLPKKTRTRTRSRVNHPICNVCSINFVTTQALSEHIYTHSPEELQEAFRLRKAKIMADSQAAREASEKNKQRPAENQEVEESSVPNVDGSKKSQKDISEETERVILSNAGTNVDEATDCESISTTVCPCHRDDQANADKNDLQIEMVLICQYCQVLFRRRECFEVHYRTSPRCANDRTQGRWPRLFCANCQLTLRSWADMRHHLEVHASVNAEGTVRFVCNICRVVFVGFGALFYYHWFSHLKDTMFVASRYTFPKNSVQPIDGLAKLPIGASVDESYIWVAEHVCAECKKPFSTRRDLVLHQETDTCCNKVLAVETSKESVHTNESQWYCDVCDITFENRDKLNDHGVTRHGRHYTCVSTSPKHKTFMCTRCCAMRKRIKDIEEHWKTHPQHNLCRFDMETNTETTEVDDGQLATLTPFVKENQLVDNSSSAKEGRADVGNKSSDNSAIKTKVTISSEESRKSEELAKKSSENKEIRPEIDIVFQAIAENSESQTTEICTENQKSSIASVRSDETAKKTDAPLLYNLLNEIPSKTESAEKQRTRIRALEDPCVSVVMSDSSSTNLSASLVIDESFNKTTDESTENSNTESYKILMMDNNPKSSSGSIKMIFGRTSAGNAAEKLPDSRTSNSVKVNQEKNIEKASSSKCSSVTEKNATAVAKESLLKKTTVTGSIDAKAGGKMTSKKNKNSSQIPKKNESNLSIPASLNDNYGAPEIIEISEEIDMRNEKLQIPSNLNSSTRSKVPAAKSTSTAKSTPRNKKSSVIKLNKGVAAMKIGTPKTPLATRKKSSQENSSGSEMNSIVTSTDSGRTDSSEAALLGRREPKLSFEEARYAARLLSNKNTADEAAVAKKPGFLRVKNLSELQAVKHVCPICNAIFDSSSLLEEHEQIHLQNSFGKVAAKQSKGMTAVLVLPETSERPKTPCIAPASKNLKYQTTLIVPNLSERPKTPYVTPASKNLQCPPTLILPDPSERPKTPYAVLTSKNIKCPPTQSYIPQRVSSINTATSVNTVNNRGTGGSWIRLEGQKTSNSSLNGAGVTSATSVNTANNRRSGDSWIGLGNQKTSNASMTAANALGNFLTKYNINIDASAKSVITSTASTSQPQQNFTSQSQPINSTVGYIAMPDIHRQLPESRNSGQIGYHILPAMVVPSPQSSRQHATVASQQNSSSNNLPLSGLSAVAPPTQQQIEGISEFVCTICSIFRCETVEAFKEHVTKHLVGFNSMNAGQNTTQPTVSTVIVPQTSPFGTINDSVPNSIPDNTTKNTSDRLVVNNWILSNPTMGWPNTTFNQQSASSALPITTQSLLTTTVQNSNGNGANSGKPSTAWATSTYNPPMLSSVVTMVKQSGPTPTPPNSNNNGTNTLKQTGGWSGSALSNATEIIGGQIIYQCMICKSAMYSDYEHVRRHVNFVHGIENFLKYRIGTIVQKNYYCTRCPNGAAPFDSAAKLQMHQNTSHSNVCPSCNQVFYNYTYFNDHMTHCPTTNTQGNFGGNC